MRGEFVAPLLLPDEGAHLHVLADDLLGPRPVVQDKVVEQRLVERAASAGLENGCSDVVAAPEAERVHQAEIGDLRSVGDETEDRVLQVVADRREHLVGQVGAQRLALAVDVEIVAAREVDALERAGRPWQRHRERRRGHRAALLDHHHVAGRDFAHCRCVEVEHGHQRRPLGGKRHHLVVLEVMDRADAGGVAHHEGVAVPDQPGEGVAAIPVLGGAGDDAGNVKILADAVREFGTRETARAERPVEVLVLLVEVKADPLEQRLGVGGKDGVLADGDEAVVQLPRVRHVEVPRQHQVAGRPGTAAEKRMAGAQIVAARGAIAQMAEQQLAAEVEVPLDRLGELRVDRALAHLFRVPVQQILEDAVEGIGLDVAFAEHVRFARRDLELHARQTRPILTAVVLLLHQEEKLEDAPQWRAVFLLVVGKRLQEPHQRHAAFVSD